MSDQSTYPPPTRGLPTTDVLVEARPNSMADLFSRKADYLTDQDIDQIVLHMRDLRVRLESTATVRHARVPRDDAVPRASRSRKVVMDFSEIDFSKA